MELHLVRLVLEVGDALIFRYFVSRKSKTHKTKDRVTRTPLKTGVNSGALEG